MSVKAWLIIIAAIGIAWLIFEVVRDAIVTLKQHDKEDLFKKKCPNVICIWCDYHYFDENNKSCCQLYEQLGLDKDKPNTGDEKEE